MHLFKEEHAVFKHSRLLALPAVAVAAIALAACSSSGTGSTGTATKSSNDDAPAKITVATVLNDQPAIKPIVDAFQKKYPNITVTLTSADTSPYQTTLRTQLSANNGPDVFYTYPGAGNPAGESLLAQAGYLKDLSDQPFVKKLPKGIQDLAKYKGKTYVRPMTVGGIGMVFNMDALKQTGLDVPTTFSDVLQLCSDAKDKGKVAFALGGATPSNVQFIDYALIPSLVYAKDPTFNTKMSEGKATFAGSDGWNKAMQMNVQMQKAGCFEKDPLGVQYPDAAKMVASGDALAIVQTQGSIAQLKLSNPSGDFQLQPFPADDKEADTYMASSIGAEYAINAHSKSPAAAQKFLDFLSSDEQENAYATAGNSVPAIQNAKSSVPASIASIGKFQKEGKTFPYPDPYWPNAQVQQAHLTGMQEVLSGQGSVADALKGMDTAYKG
jgi:raffinose/stachyose/melibiose transport system substrate-binding protein